MNTIAWSAGAAILVGFLLWMINAVKPLWRSAGLVLIAALAAGYLAPCCEACDKGGGGMRQSEQINRFPGNKRNGLEASFSANWCNCVIGYGNK